MYMHLDLLVSKRVEAIRGGHPILPACGYNRRQSVSFFASLRPPSGLFLSQREPDSSNMLADNASRIEHSSSKDLDRLELPGDDTLFLSSKGAAKVGSLGRLRTVFLCPSASAFWHIDVSSAPWSLVGSKGSCMIQV